jgi:N-acetyl-anhydromuramyl-L-alanine amidase AmpD
MRMMTGEPYLHFIDESNRKMPQWLKDKGLSINQSNLCSEIILPTDVKRTAVCCLSSLNLEHYDAWKNDKLFLKDVAEMLDNVLQYFIDKAPNTIKRAKYSATRERSIGIGALGWHAGPGYNRSSIGVEVIGANDQDILNRSRTNNKAQLIAVARLAEYLGFKKSQIKGHGDISSANVGEGKTIVNYINTL